MRPLASPVVEYRLIGIAQLLSGAALAVAAFGIEASAATAINLLLAGVPFGTAMYLLAYRRYVRRAVVNLAAPATAERESTTRTRRRVALTETPGLVVLAAVALLLEVPTLAGGFAAGSGAALLLISRRLSNWEQEHDSRLLREPRWRWSRAGRRGWGRGGGIMDPQDFYVEGSNPRVE